MIRAGWWAPAAVLALGAALTSLAGAQRTVPLRAPLEAHVPATLAGHVGRDVAIPEAEWEVAAPTTALFRAYAPAGERGAAFSVYVGFYASQARGRTIHSPKNCLPGGGWEVLDSRTQAVATAAGPVTVNRYRLHREGSDALVLYWYQGRGRVEASEYRVKWHLLRDAAVHRRSDEALVRILVPVRGTEAEAEALALRVAASLVPAVDAALPTI